MIIFLFFLIKLYLNKFKLYLAEMDIESENDETNKKPNVFFKF